MEAKIQNSGGTFAAGALSLPRQDLSALGEVGTQVEASRDLADRLGVTADIEKLAFSGLTAHQIAGALKERLDAGQTQTEGGAKPSPRDQAYFISRVRMSLGVPPVDDPAGFQAWKEQVSARLKETAETVLPETAKAAPVMSGVAAVDSATTKDKPEEIKTPGTAQTKATPGLNTIEPDLEKDRPKCQFSA